MPRCNRRLCCQNMRRKPICQCRLEIILISLLASIMLSMLAQCSEYVSFSSNLFLPPLTTRLGTSQRPPTKLHPPPRRLPWPCFYRRYFRHTNPSPKRPNTPRSHCRPKDSLLWPLSPSRHRARTRLLPLHLKPPWRTHSNQESSREYIWLCVDE